MTREGIGELMEYLEEDLPHLTFEQARLRQNAGWSEWEP